MSISVVKRVRHRKPSGVVGASMAPRAPQAPQTQQIPQAWQPGGNAPPNLLRIATGGPMQGPAMERSSPSVAPSGMPSFGRPMFGKGGMFPTEVLPGQTSPQSATQSAQAGSGLGAFGKIAQQATQQYGPRTVFNTPDITPDIGIGPGQGLTPMQQYRQGLGQGLNATANGVGQEAFWSQVDGPAQQQYIDQVQDMYRRGDPNTGTLIEQGLQRGIRIPQWMVDLYQNGNMPMTDEQRERRRREIGQRLDGEFDAADSMRRIQIIQEFKPEQYGLDGVDANGQPSWVEQDALDRIRKIQSVIKSNPNADPVLVKELYNELSGIRNEYLSGKMTQRGRQEAAKAAEDRAKQEAEQRKLQKEQFTQDLEEWKYVGQEIDNEIQNITDERDERRKTIEKLNGIDPDKRTPAEVQELESAYQRLKELDKAYDEARKEKTEWFRWRPRQDKTPKWKEGQDSQPRTQPEQPPAAQQTEAPRVSPADFAGAVQSDGTGWDQAAYDAMTEDEKNEVARLLAEKGIVQ